MINDTLHHCSTQKKIINEALRVANVVLIYDVEPNFTTFILDLLTNLLHYGHFGLPWCTKKAIFWNEYFKELDLDYEYRIAKKLGGIHSSSLRLG